MITVKKKRDRENLACVVNPGICMENVTSIVGMIRIGGEIILECQKYLGFYIYLFTVNF